MQSTARKLQLVANEGLSNRQLSRISFFLDTNNSREDFPSMCRMALSKLDCQENPLKSNHMKLPSG